MDLHLHSTFTSCTTVANVACVIGNITFVLGCSTPLMSPYLFTIYNKCKMLDELYVIISHPFCMDLLVVTL
jgi:hypothetical protein